MSATAVTITRVLSVTGGSVLSSVPLAVTTNNVNVKKIVWTGASNASDALAVVDAAGNTLWKAKQPTANGGNIETNFSFNDGMPTNGITCSRMDSGELYIYI